MQSRIANKSFNVLAFFASLLCQGGMESKNTFRRVAASLSWNLGYAEHSFLIGMVSRVGGCMAGEARDGDRVIAQPSCVRKLWGDGILERW